MEAVETVYMIRMCALAYILYMTYFILFLGIYDTSQGRSLESRTSRISSTACS